jgi:hypothetical protein
MVDEEAVAKLEPTVHRVADAYRPPYRALLRVTGANIAEECEAILGLVGSEIRLAPDGDTLVGEYRLRRETLVFACLGRAAVRRRADISVGSGGRI